MLLSALKLTKIMLHSKKAQETEGGGSGGNVWLVVGIIFFLLCLFVFGYLVAIGFLPDFGGIVATITNAVSKIRNIGG